MDLRAFYGPMERIVEETTKESEVTKVGVAMQMLVWISTTLRAFYFPNGDDKLPLNIYMLLIGFSAIGRKGTSIRIADRYSPRRSKGWRYLGEPDRIHRRRGSPPARPLRTKSGLLRDRLADDQEPVRRSFSEAEGEMDVDALLGELASAEREIAERKAYLRTKLGLPGR